MSEGHNGPSKDDYMRHQAVAIIMAEKKAALNAEVNRARKQAKAAGIELGDLDFTVKAMSWTVGEIAAHFKRRLSYLAFNEISIGEVDKLFGVSTEDTRYAGVMAGMSGKVCSPPANNTQNEKQLWIQGWHEGNRHRDGALFDLKEQDSKAEAARAAMPATPDETTEAAQELGDAGYGEELPEIKAEAEDDEPDASPHQAVKRTRIKRTPDPVQ